MTNAAEGLDRFVEAQEGVFDRALGELRAGRKESHWMWFVLPQIAGLGVSAMAQRYAIQDRAEAAAYLAHPLLGSRLLSCVEAVLQHRDRSARAIFGQPDDRKFQSCLTLFEAAAVEHGAHRAAGLFSEALDTFYDGTRDPATGRLLGGESPD